MKQLWDGSIFISKSFYLEIFPMDYHHIDFDNFETTAVCKDNFSYPTLTIGATYKAKFEDWVWLFNWDNDMWRDYPMEYFELAVVGLDERIQQKNDLEDEIAELENEHDNLSRKRDNLEEEIDDHKSDLSALNEDIEEYNAMIEEDPSDENPEYLEEKIENIKNLDKVIEEKEEKLKELDEEMDELYDSISEKESEIEEIMEMLKKVL